MNNNRNQGREQKPQEEQRHPDEWQNDLNPEHLAGQNIGSGSGEGRDEDGSAFHLRKRGEYVGPLDDDELKQVPVLPPGTRLQQGATYVDLKDGNRHEFTARGDMFADANHKFVPKDRVPYEIWNRLIGEEKPGQVRKP